MISSDADVVSFELDGSEDYMVLACDGAWDCICKENLPHIIYDHVQKNNGQCSTVAELLVKFASDNGSTDNISVIVVFFKEVLPDPKLSLNEVIKENGENKKHDHNPNRNSGGDPSSSSQGRNLGDLNSGFRKPEKGSKLCGSEKLIPCFSGGETSEDQIPEAAVPTSCEDSNDILPISVRKSGIHQGYYSPVSKSNCPKQLEGKILEIQVELLHWFMLEALKRHWTQMGGRIFADSLICGQLTCVCLQKICKSVLSSLSQVVRASECYLCECENGQSDAERPQSAHICIPSCSSSSSSSSSLLLDSSSFSTPTSGQTFTLSDMTRVSTINPFSSFLRLCPRHLALSSTSHSVLNGPKLAACSSVISARCLFHHPFSVPTDFASGLWASATASTCPVVLSATSWHHWGHLLMVGSRLTDWVTGGSCVKIGTCKLVPSPTVCYEIHPS